MDRDLLKRIDADQETQQKGRSAFVRSAVELYLKAKQRKEVEAQLDRAYSGEADAMLEEISDFIGEQAWPRG